MIACKFIICMICKTSFWDSTATSGARPFIAARQSKCCFTYEVQRESGLEVYEAVFLNIKNISKICLFYLIHIRVCCWYSVIRGKVIMANKRRNWKNEQIGWVTQEIRGHHWLQCNWSILGFSTCNGENNELLRGKSL